MDELYLDLTHDATRQSLYLELLSRLSDEERDCIRETLEHAAIPEVHHANLAAVYKTLGALEVSEKVKGDAWAIYHILADAEATVHECTIEDTHFHEVGQGSAIRNTIGICLAFEALSPSRVVASCVQTGRGKVKCAHGELDIPAPATKAILDQGIPLCPKKLEGELCTPTSAAIIKHFVDEFV